MGDIVMSGSSVRAVVRLAGETRPATNEQIEMKSHYLAYQFEFEEENDLGGLV